MSDVSFPLMGRSLSPTTGKTQGWTLNLDVLAFGTGPDGVRARPKLTGRLLPAFSHLFRQGTKATAYRSRYNLIYFWQFLDHQERTAAVLDARNPLEIDDITWPELEALWRHFLDYLRAKPEKEMSNRTKYYVNSTVVQVFSKAHELELARGVTDKPTLDIYTYFSSSRTSSYGGDPLTFEEAKQIFAVLARNWRNMLSRFDRGNKLADQGRNPMTGSSGVSRWEGGGWQNLCNRLWIARNFAHFDVQRPKDDKLDFRIRSGLRYPIPAENFLHVYGFDNGGGPWAHIACIVPTMHEMSVAMAMVTMKTGMNPDAVARMRVDRWCKPDPMHPDRKVVLFGPKRIGNKLVHASSSSHRLTDAFQIIRKVIDLLMPYRGYLAAQAKSTGDAKLAEMSGLIWVFPTPRGVGSFLPNSNMTEGSYKYLDKMLADALPPVEGRRLRYRYSDGRDIWGLFVYHKSGFNHILTAQALGHSSLVALLHYLEKRTVKVADRIRLIELQGKVLSDLGTGDYSPRRYRETLSPPTQTLVAHTVQASTGLQCGDPTHPDPDADPGNSGGRTCRTQACWTCSKWYATAESLPALLRIIDDLTGLRELIPAASWETSDYPSMLEIYGFIVAKFHPEIVGKARVRSAVLPPIVTTAQFSATRAEGAR